MKSSSDHSLTFYKYNFKLCIIMTTTPDVYNCSKCKMVSESDVSIFGPFKGFSVFPNYVPWTSNQVTAVWAFKEQVSRWRDPMSFISTWASMRVQVSTGYIRIE